MSGLLTYAALGILFLFLVGLLFRRSQSGRSTATALERNPVQDLRDEGFLTLAERIFDSRDYHWLRHNLGLPHLARALGHSRRRLALRWLTALRAAFDSRVFTLHDPSSQDSFRWRGPYYYFVYRTVWFYLVWAYAWSAVFVFGPHHRLIPSLDWERFVLGYSSGRDLPGAINSTHLR